MKKSLKFGVIADLHVQLAATAEQYLTEFLEDCRKADVDFIIQLGDFCMPLGDRRLCADYSVNDRVIAMYSGFEKPAFHVIGNHDIDVCTKKEILEFWQTDCKPYYSFDMGGFHFVVLDCNYMKIGEEYVSYEHGSYYAYAGKAKPVLPVIPEEQIQWLKEDLAKTPYPSVLFSHQRLAGRIPGILINQTDLRQVIDQAPSKVVLSINGHEHLDYAEKYADTWYYSMNSVTMQWLGEENAVPCRFTPEIDEQFPYVQYTVPYSKALYAIVTMDEKGASVKGRKGEFVGLAPEEQGIYDKHPWYKECREQSIMITPNVEDRYMEF